MPDYVYEREVFDFDNPEFKSTLTTFHADKKTLFNLYAFTYHDSFQKIRSAIGDQDHDD